MDEKLGNDKIMEHKPYLTGIKTGDLINELLSREKVWSMSVSHGSRFPDLSHTDNNDLRIGPAKIIVVETFNRQDGYKS